MFFDFYPENIVNSFNSVKGLRLSILATFLFEGMNFGSVIRDNIIFIMGDDLMDLSIGLYHFLMVAPALD